MRRPTYARLPEATHPHIAATAGHLITTMRRSSCPAALDLLLTAAAALPAEVPEGKV
ncbi:hypothetical protein [Streptomyces sp. NPDC014006]|uniref:hypothetical protein n=1 Tax=Streptomyces sp. NPDC014006 TaxID=3364870 RepID=UPI0036FB6DA7